MSLALAGYKQILTEEINRARRNNSWKERKTLSQTGCQTSVSNIQLIDNARNDGNAKYQELRFEEFEKFSWSARSTFILPDINSVERKLGSYMRNDLLCIDTLWLLKTKGKILKVLIPSINVNANKK